ncbi:MAG: YdjY domain-containing protein [Isosphaeraceae bacterium]|jgi:hypothetical protein
MVLLLYCVSVLLAGDEPPAVEPAQRPAANTLEPSPQWKPLGRSLWFDPGNKQLVVRAKVVLREGPLEHLVCLKGTKEHEAILATDAQPRQIHAGLLLTGAEPGHPVRFQPKFEPPAGTPIAIELLWMTDGKLHRSDARDWVKDEKTRKPLAEHWVFAGSDLYTDPVTQKTMYAADEGDLITVANFGGAILDLPLASSASDADRIFSADTAHVPPLGTEVLLRLGPGTQRPEKKP